MLVTQRNRQIRELRRKNPKVNTLKVLSKRYRITPERVRQICSSRLDVKDLYLKIDQSYKDKLIKGADYNWVKTEVRRLSKQDRKKSTVIERRILVKYLVDKMDFSFFQVGILLNRHHTSITNLYYGESI